MNGDESPLEESTVYDGQRLRGTVTGNARGWLAVTADGTVINTFESRRDASNAVLAAGAALVEEGERI